MRTQVKQGIMVKNRVVEYILELPKTVNACIYL